MPLAEPFAEFREKALDAVLLHRLERHAIDAPGTTIRARTPPRFPQDVTPADTVVQRMETSSTIPLG
jgi:hypothetical protein